MNGCDLKSAFDQLGHHRIDFGFEKHDVAHNHRATMRWLKCHPATKGQRWFDGDAIERHRKIGSWKTVTMNIARHRRLSPERRIDLLPVDFLGTNGGRNKTAPAVKEAINARMPTS